MNKSKIIIVNNKEYIQNESAPNNHKIPIVNNVVNNNGMELYTHSKTINQLLEIVEHVENWRRLTVLKNDDGYTLVRLK